MVVFPLVATALNYFYVFTIDADEFIYLLVLQFMCVGNYIYLFIFAPNNLKSFFFTIHFPLQIRHIDNAQVGYLAKKSFQSNNPSGSTASDLHIAFLSQQQLKGFNLPYQLGFTNIEGTPNAFESPTDADTGSISGNIDAFGFVGFVVVFLLVCDDVSFVRNFLDINSSILFLQLTY